MDLLCSTEQIVLNPVLELSLIPETMLSGAVSPDWITNKLVLGEWGGKMRFKKTPMIMNTKTRTAPWSLVGEHLVPGPLPMESGCMGSTCPPPTGRAVGILCNVNWVEVKAKGAGGNLSLCGRLGDTSYSSANTHLGFWYPFYWREVGLISLPLLFWVRGGEKVWAY